MEKPSVIINQLPFPNQMASDEEKSSEKYGLSVAKAIEGEWFKRKGNSHHEDLHKNRGSGHHSSGGRPKGL